MSGALFSTRYGGRGAVALTLCTILATIACRLGTTPWQTANQAPLRKSPKSRKRVPRGEDEPNSSNMEGAYAVHFKRGYSLDRHMEFMGDEDDISLYVQKLFTKEEGKTVYTCQSVDSDLLVRIRSDPGVELVEHDLIPYTPEDFA